MGVLLLIKKVLKQNNVYKTKGSAAGRKAN